MQQHRARLSFDTLLFVISLAAIVIGLRASSTQYLTPQTGLGYALGIIGGSMMLLVVIYPLLKRMPGLRFLGTVPGWFRAHMMLGIIGPICILFHSNFSLGATNSNVALFCMLIVAGSGLVGRYFYAKIHDGLYGRKSTLVELQARKAALTSQGQEVPLLPELISRLEREEQRLVAWGRGGAAVLIAPLMIATAAAGARRRLHRYIRSALVAAATTSRPIAAQRTRVERVACEYADRRVRASVDVAEFRIYERLFSAWHVLHFPMFFMLLAAGIVHVVAVHVY